MDRGHVKIEATSDVLYRALEDVRSHLRNYSDLTAILTTGSTTFLESDTRIGSSSP